MNESLKLKLKLFNFVSISGKEIIYCSYFSGIKVLINGTKILFEGIKVLLLLWLKIIISWYNGIMVLSV